MKKLIEQQIEFLKKCLEDTADGSWSTHLNKPIQKQIENLTEQLRLYDVVVSLPTEEELISELDKTLDKLKDHEMKLFRHRNYQRGYDAGFMSAYEFIKYR